MTWQDTVNEVILYALETILISIKNNEKTSNTLKKDIDSDIKMINIVKDTYEKFRAIEDKNESD